MQNETFPSKYKVDPTPPGVIHTALGGFLMGVANIIPGVSGGTLALILGIYKRLIEALHNINLDTIKIGMKWLTNPVKHFPALGEECKRIDLLFLALIGIGAFVAIVATSGLMAYVLDHHHAAEVVLPLQ